MEPRVKELMRELFESYLNSVEAILDMDLIPEGMSKVGGGLQQSVGHTSPQCAGTTTTICVR
jgi:hypothetical protein